MIRYGVTKAELVAAISELNGTWLERARERTEIYADRGRFVTPPSHIWNQVKRVYMGFQGSKCGFCERRLEQSAFGNVEHDVEHFRPKASVASWPPASRPERSEGLDFPLGEPSDDLGYSLLPHHHENYLIACKTCNSAFKGNGFPVDGVRDLTMATPRRTDERPYLCYPIGMFDDDPQALIRFEGIVPVPAGARGRRRRRGQVIINFFGLAEREGLLIERSITLLSLHLALVHRDDDGDPLTAAVATHLLGTLIADHAAHANCARSFVEMWDEDHEAAGEFTAAAIAYLLTI